MFLFLFIYNFIFIFIWQTERLEHAQCGNLCIFFNVLKDLMFGMIWFVVGKSFMWEWLNHNKLNTKIYWFIYFYFVRWNRFSYFDLFLLFNVFFFSLNILLNEAFVARYEFATFVREFFGFVFGNWFWFVGIFDWIYFFSSVCMYGCQCVYLCSVLTIII